MESENTILSEILVSKFISDHDRLDLHPYSNLRELLTNRIAFLLSTNPNKLMHILYSVDVGEPIVANIFNQADSLDIPELLADAVIERQKKKIFPEMHTKHNPLRQLKIVCNTVKNLSAAQCTLIVCFLALFSKAQAEETYDIETLRTLHYLLQEKKTTQVIYTFLTEHNIISSFLNKQLQTPRMPDYILLYIGVEQRDRYAIFSTKTNKEVSSCDSGDVVCSIIVEDDANEHYRLSLDYRNEKGSFTAESLNEIFTTSQRTLPFADYPVPNVPHYVAHISFYRIRPPCSVFVETLALPGEKLTRNYFGFGAGYGLGLHPCPDIRFSGDTAVVAGEQGKSLQGNGMATLSFFPGRDPRRVYPSWFSDPDYFQHFHERFSLTLGMVFTRSNQLLEQWMLGVSYRAALRADLTFGAVLTTTPAIGSSGVLYWKDHWRADQLLPSRRIAAVYIGLSINFLEW